MALTKDQIDELDSWFDEEEEEGEEDQSAPEPVEAEEESSTSEEEAGEVPDQETPELAAAEAADAGSDTQPAPASDDEYSWVAQLDPELRQQVEALVHRDKSNRGRVASFQARLDKVYAERDALQQAAAQQPPTQAAIGEPTPEEADDPALEEFRQQYPNVADSVERMIEQRVMAERAQLQQQITPLHQQRAQERMEQARQQLRAASDRLFNSAETGVQLEDVVNSPKWNEWMSTQPEGYRRFATTTSNPDDAIKVLEDFARYAHQEQEAQAAATAPAVTPSHTPDDATLQVAARRQQALAGSTPPSKSGTLDDGGKGSYEDAFDYFVDNNIS